MMSQERRIHGGGGEGEGGAYTASSGMSTL